MSARSRSTSRRAESAVVAPVSDMIEIPRKEEGCVVQTSRRVTLEDLKGYYNFAPFYFIYKNPKNLLKEHLFMFHIGIVTPDNRQILTKRLTYSDLRIRNDRDLFKFKAKLEKAIKTYNITEWFIPLLEIIKSDYAWNILASAIKSIQFDTTANRNIMPKPSNIDSAIEPTPTIRREIEKRKGANLLVEFDQDFVNRSIITSGKGTDRYDIYFTFQMKPDAEPYVKKRIMTTFCIKNADGSEEPRYIKHSPSETHQVYTPDDLPFRLHGGQRKTRRRQRHRRNRTSK